MERIAVFFKLKPGMAEAYKERHDRIWPEMSEALCSAGIKNYSIWRKDDMLFGYYETEDAQRADTVLQSLPIYAKWRNEMEEYIYKESVTGRKEWPMELMFFHE